jgi:hypothetical protein
MSSDKKSLCHNELPSFVVISLSVAQDIADDFSELVYVCFGVCSREESHLICRGGERNPALKQRVKELGVTIYSGVCDAFGASGRFTFAK